MALDVSQPLQARIGWVVHYFFVQGVSPQHVSHVGVRVAGGA